MQFVTRYARHESGTVLIGCAPLWQLHAPDAECEGAYGGRQSVSPR